jgi:hypothetical protein
MGRKLLLLWTTSDAFLEGEGGANRTNVNRVIVAVMFGIGNYK